MQNRMTWQMATATTDVAPKPTCHNALEWVCGAFDNFPEGLDHIEVEDEDKNLAEEKNDDDDDDDDDDFVLHMEWRLEW